ncbi:DUF2076 domain-containing protein [Amorphus sp. 3PC139-8]|uniref:DUF2076 domain-containing protein n=1 Tax=Amorphus sp. 3PC139-8 TaxID=2735676 RepID=UPI00345D14A8
MTPTERELLSRLFDRIDQASSGPRDGEAEALIAERVAANPQAAYRMAQTIAVQDKALNRAEEKIRNLEAAPERRSDAPPARSLADEADAALPPRRSSVPTAGARPAGFGAGGFLAGAGQVALGIVGGSLLMEGIRGLMGNDGAAQAGEGAGVDGAPADAAGADPGQDYADADGDMDADGGGFLDGMFDDWG